MITRNEAQRFLTQATFGASPTDIDNLVAIGDYGTWIDQQWAEPVSLQLPYAQANGNGSDDRPRHHIWWSNAMTGSDQLRQRVAFALSELFVISDRDYSISNSIYGVAQFYDELTRHADGNYRDLLGVVTLHPIMGIYLSMLRNQRADPANNIRPDENFAREVLQLFSIGLVELNNNGVPRLSGGEPIPTFDQDIVEEFARVFTGWTFGGTTEFTSNDLVGYDTTRPMEAVVAMHDSGAKTLLGGQANPAGLSPAADVNRALDNIAAHPNVGPFISTFLIQRLVTSNPSPAYVGRVAAVFNNDGTGTKGNLGATVKAILLDPDARNGANIADFGKVKEPLLRFTQIWRAMNGFNPRGANATWRPPYTAADAIENVAGQAVMRSPSVFNFFQPDYSPPGTPLLAPEMQIHTEAFISEMNRALHGQIYGFNNRSNGYDAVTRIDVEREVEMAGDIDVLVDHLDDLLLGGLMPPGHRQAMTSHLASISDDAEGRYLRAVDAIFMVVGSPACMVQR